MSFWPFGNMGASSSRIGQVLEEYMDILHGLENQQNDLPVSPLDEDTISPTANSNPVALEPAQSPRLAAQKVPSGGRSTPSVSLSRSAGRSSNRSSAGSPSLLTTSMLNSSFIEAVLEDAQLLHELSSNNSTLIDFICFGYFYDNDVKVTNMDYLVDQLLKACHNDDTQRGTTISEMFSMQIWLISSALATQPYLVKLYELVSHVEFRNPASSVASLMFKIMENLLDAKPDQVLNFVRTRDTLVDDFLASFGNTAVMDFLLRIITTDKQDTPTGILEFVNDQQIIGKLLGMLSNNDLDMDIQNNVADFLKAIVAVSANAPIDEMTMGPNILTRELSSRESCEILLDAIVVQGGTALANSVGVVIELIRKNNSDYDMVNLLDTSVQTHPPSQRDPIYLGHLLSTFADNMDKLYEAMVSKGETCPILTNQLGQEFQALGFERFRIVELVAELLHCSNMQLLNSKKAERIVAERDEYRKCLSSQLEDALNDLTMDENNDSNDVLQAQEPEDLDEEFETPYVNDKQYAKVTTQPSVGDRFKIQLHRVGFLSKVATMFLEFPWNNFWHNVCFDIIQQIFNGKMDTSYNSFLVASLFESDGFLVTRDLILKGYKQGNVGYLGHLVLVAEEIVKFQGYYQVDLISPTIAQHLEAPEWKEFVETTLLQTREAYNCVLGGLKFNQQEEIDRRNEENGVIILQ